MATIKTSSDLAQQLRALVPDLPRYCTRIVLTLAHDSYPEVVATFHPDFDAPAAGETITQRYQLIPIYEPAPKAPNDRAG